VYSGPVDDPEVLAATTLDRRLHEAALAAGEPIDRLEDHAFPTFRREIFPPLHRGGDACLVFEVDEQMTSETEQRAIGSGKPAGHIEMPAVVAF
jgi:hypothetical protein